ncbi:hypothetical protein AURDEDRAFT_116281 [Auricularia subglabra TFB-10046 SS5]|uniref:Methyltransferase n=1 Tax=Auricularia subglabra (strain TFB-10046 / SS5) TaxID=717982 RepID=J0WX61_AURST|nr:hypothetical protein AURDEDRAFT_116281 [Auricularia subglabra TFB-10046 SS5]
MSVAVQSAPGLASVQTDFNFIIPTEEKPYFYSSAPPEGKPPTNIASESHKVNVTDLRSLPDEERAKFTIDTAGFQIVKHESAEKEFVDEEAITTKYYKEIEELIKRETGAKRIFIFDHTIRRAPHTAAPGPAVRGPVQRAHVDQTPKAGAARVFYHLPEEAERLSKGRVQIINVWRPLKPVVDAPLAYADYSSIDPEKDVIATDLIYPHRTGETYSVKYNPAQRWYYLRDQTPGEVVFLKCYESEVVPGRALLTPHSAFVDPTAPAGAPNRESIEIRALVFYQE